MTLETSRRGRGWLTLAILAMVFGPVATARAQLNVVYTESNIGSIANDNSVYGYSLDTTTGILTALPGSPYLTNGEGIYNPGDSSGAADADQEVIIRPDDQNLLAINAHTDTIASFFINTDGSLTAAAGSPYPSNGQDPVSLGLADNFLGTNLSWLGVVNKNADPGQPQQGTTPNMAMFKLNAFGKMQAIPAATVALPAGSSPAQALVLNSDHRVYVDLFESAPAINAYTILSTGFVSFVNSAGPPVTGEQILGLAVNPTYKYIYAGLPFLAEVGVYSYNSSTGAISFVKEVANPGTLVCWIKINTAGTYMYTAETGSGTITVYSLAHPATPTEVQHFKLAKTSGVTIPNSANLAFDPTGAYLYCLDNVNSVLHVLAVNSSTGELTEPNPPLILPQPTGEEAIGLATAMINN